MSNHGSRHCLWSALMAGLVLGSTPAVAQERIGQYERDYEYSVEYGFYDDDELEYEEPEHEYFQRNREIVREPWIEDEGADNQYFDDAGEYEYFDDDPALGVQIEDDEIAERREIDRYDRDMRDEDVLEDDDYRDDLIEDELEDEDYYREGWYESYYGHDPDEAEWFEGDEDGQFYYDNFYGSYYSDESNSDWWD